MSLLDIIILSFIFIEFINVLILYIKPDSKFSSLSLFNNFNESKKDNNLYLFIKYLINYIASIKVMYIIFLINTIIFSSNHFKIYTIMGTTLSIIIYFISIYSIVKNLDNNNCINPKGFSKLLKLLITFFITILIVFLIIHL